VVDLDGTLIASDSLLESLLRMCRLKPLGLLEVPGWMMQGRALLKRRLAENGELDPKALPYRPRVLELIKSAREQGRPIILASACNKAIAHAVAEHLGLFDDVIASDGKTNCRDTTKLAHIREAIKTLENPPADAGFDYVGDSKHDLPIWREAETAYTVDAKPSVAHAAKGKRETIELLPRQGGNALALLRGMRIHQWIKNVLLLVPLVLAHQAEDMSKWGALAVAFLAMGMCASAVYLVNDLLDLRADRLHPTKCRRPLASGALRIPIAVAAAPMLVVVAAALAWLMLPPMFVGVLLIYTASAWFYSLFVKGKSILDVVWLACLYCVRIIAGGVAVGVDSSAWLLAFALFMFLSLAFAKRYSELRLLADEGREQAEGRAYQTQDQQILSMMGIGSGYMAVLVLALYINSDKVTTLYHDPHALWIACPMILYWVSRLWMRAHRRLLKDDPLLFALTDRVSYLTIAIVALATMIAS